MKLNKKLNLLVGNRHIATICTDELLQHLEKKEVREELARRPKTKTRHYKPTPNRYRPSK